MSDKTRNTYRWERIDDELMGAWLYRGGEMVGQITDIALAERVVRALNIEAAAEVAGAEVRP